MKHVKSFEDWDYKNLHNTKTFTVYRGTNYDEKFDRDDIFLSCSKRFAEDYGDNIYEVKIQPKKIFDSLNPDHWRLLYKWSSSIRDEYNDNTYYSYEEMVEKYPSFESDTWEMMEEELYTIKSEGYDCALITEGGALNFVVFDSNIIVDTKLVSNLDESVNTHIDTIINKLQNPKFKDKIKDFLLKCKEEGGDYKEAGQILSKYASGEKPSKEEMKKVYTQLVDTLKIGGSGTLFMLPFGSVLLIVLIKIGNKFGINFLPSAWDKKN